MIVVTVWMGIYPATFLDPIMCRSSNLIEQHERLAACAKRAVRHAAHAEKEMQTGANCRISLPACRRIFLACRRDGADDGRRVLGGPVAGQRRGWRSWRSCGYRRDHVADRPDGGRTIAALNGLFRRRRFAHLHEDADPGLAPRLAIVMSMDYIHAREWNGSNSRC